MDTNLTGSDRLGTITIAGQTFTITQPALPCSVTLTSPPTSLGEFGGAGLFTFTVLPVGCSVNVQSYASWLTLTDLSVPGTVRFSAAPNTYASARSGTISVGDKTYQVDEAASSCAYTLTSFAATPPFAQAGGPGAIPMLFGHIELPFMFCHPHSALKCRRM